MINVDRKQCLTILEWCKDKWGQSEYFSGFPKLVVHKTTLSPLEKNKTYIITGEHLDSDNTIHVYLRRILNVEELCSTIIHEYWHYKQNSDDYWDEMFMLKLRYKIESPKCFHIHPHEKRCNRYAYRYKQKCLKDLNIS